LPLLKQNEKIGKKKERKEKKFRQPWYNLLTAFHQTCSIPEGKGKLERRIQWPWEGGGLLPKPIHFEE
jgi:hypothetical protein